MAGIFGDPNDGGGERAYAPYYDLQDGNGELQPAAVYVNLQDGNGEQLIWQAKTMVEDFEDGDHLNWDRWDAAWTVDTTAALDGTTYGAHGDPATGGWARRHGDVGLGPGSTFEVKFRLPDSGRMIFTYGVSTNTADDHYEVFCFDPEQELSLNYDASGGGNTLIASTTVDYVATEEYRLVIEFGSAGSHTVTLYDSADTQQGQVTGTDSQFTGDGIGMWTYSSSELFVDEVYEH